MNNILNIKLNDNDLHAETIKDYLLTILMNIWTGTPVFYNKDIIRKALIENALIDGIIDETETIVSCDRNKADYLILSSIIEL